MSNYIIYSKIVHFSDRLGSVNTFRLHHVELLQSHFLAKLFMILVVMFATDVNGAQDFIIEKKLGNNYEEIRLIKKYGLFKKYVCSFHCLQLNPANKDELWFAIKYTKPAKLAKTMPDNQGSGVGCYNWKTGEIGFLSVKDGLVSNDVSVIAFDPFNRNLIWFGGSRGISLYDKKSKTFTNYSEVSGNAVYDVCEIEFDPYNTSSVWIAYTGKIMHFYRNTQRLELIEIDSQDMHKRSLEVENNSVWFASRVLLGRYYKKKRTTTYYEVNDFFEGVTPVGKSFPKMDKRNRNKLLKNKFILSIELLNHTLYVGTSDGVTCFVPEIGWEQMFTLKGITKIVKSEDKDVLWIFTRSGKIIAYNAKNHEIREFRGRINGSFLYSGRNFLYLGRERLNVRKLELDKQYSERVPVPHGQQINSVLPVGRIVYFAASKGLYKMFF